MVTNIAYWMLAATFGFAATSKVLDVESVTLAFRSLRLPSNSWFVRAVIAAEFLTSMLLVFRTRAGAIGAVFMTTVFVTVIALTLLEKRPAQCQCFGKWSAEAVSNKTLIRNIGLLLIAIGVAIT